MKISIEQKDGKVYTTSPYSNCFVTKARNLKGSWLNGQWVFDESVLEHVKNAMKDCYGVDGMSDYETCTIVVKDYDSAAWQSGLELFGRPIAKAWGRDSGAKLSDGIFLIEGSVSSSGSVKNWKTVINKATFEIHDYPVAALLRQDVQKAIQEGWTEVKGLDANAQIETQINELEKKIEELRAKLIQNSSVL